MSTLLGHDSQEADHVPVRFFVNGLMGNHQRIVHYSLKLKWMTSAQPGSQGEAL